MAQGADFPGNVIPNNSSSDGTAPSSCSVPISAALEITEEDVIGYDALWDSTLVCKGGVIWKPSVAGFYLNMPVEINKLSNSLKDGTYKPRRPVHFHITHPKPRDIVGVCFRDRVVQRSYNDNVIYPSMSPTWIYDNYACQTGKGTDFARNRVKCHLQKFYRKHGTKGWMLKADIKKYYDSMIYDVIFDNFYRKCPDWAARFAEQTIRSQYCEGHKLRGVNPGSQLVQIAGIEYLDKLDHLLKETYRIKHYGRYMDDFFIIHEDYNVLCEMKDIISDAIAEVGLTLHPDKTRIFPITRKFVFLGFNYRLTETGKVIMRIVPESVYSTKRKLRKLYLLEDDGFRPIGTCDLSYEGWRAHADKGDSYVLLSEMDEWYFEIKNS